MMNFRSRGFALLGLTAAVGFVLSGCGSLPGINESSNGSKATTQLTFQASTASHSTGTSLIGPPAGLAYDPITRSVSLTGGDAAGHPVDLTDFRIAIEEVKFKNEDESETELASDSDVEFQGPYTLDLLSSASATAQTLGDVKVPAGTYDGIEFKMHKSDELDPSDPLYRRSIYITGTVDRGSGAESFVLWHETGEEFFLTGPNGITVTDGQTGNDLIVDFKLFSILNGIDFTNAVNLLDLNPQAANSADKAIAETLKNNLETAADFGKDEDGDGEIGENEDVD